MSTERTKENTCCSDRSCGCQTDIFTTNKVCPECGKRLRLTGRAQLVEFRLACQNCGYASPLLTPEEIGELL
jgi:ribosomal protein S27AE